ncbi:DMT family transporter [Pedobacter flavus]|uniref:DMT family transporter n=1 Tax=Pedobacter flavus TaxID=3113906 RepID=A0ABU7H1Y5_9SPHI|nr:DMT family transporter [Pedobacter sp. VNH31]MEE1885254.1 DMT family transporter [Pedobacter sp. VNH31]
MKNSNPIQKDLIILHLTVMVWGFTGILGKLITIDAIPLVWFRVGIASLTLFIYIAITGIKRLAIDKTKILKYLATGGVVAIHWILFFYSIKLSTVSVALVALSAATLFTSIIEPLIKGNKILIQDVVVGLIIISGILLIFKFESQYFWGIITGLFAAIGSALFATINSTLVKNNDPKIIGFYELLGAFIWVSLYQIFAGELNFDTLILKGDDWIWLISLGTICTALAYVAGVKVMRSLSAFRVALITNLEPVYGIVLAYLIFGNSEQMTYGFYAGTLLILVAIFGYPIYKKKRSLVH